MATLVYLHGIGQGDTNREWLEALNASLASSGASAITESQVVAPNYAELLTAVTTPVPHPPVTYTEKFDPQARFEFERNQAHVERLVRGYADTRTFGFHRVPSRVVIGLQKGALAASGVSSKMRQVENYLANKELRAAVLTQILAELPADEQIVLLGHSLGSVIAIDLLDHLPREMTVRRFITIGSPAGSPVLHKKSDRILKRFPYSRVLDWTNVLDPADMVTAGKPLATLFPGAQDVWITGAATHFADTYTQHPVLARLVATAIRPRSDVSRRSQAPTRQLADGELSALLTLEFANHVSAAIKDPKTASRFDGAVALTRDNYLAEMVERAGDDGLPAEFALLAEGRMPTLPRHWKLEEAVSLAVLMSFTNVVAPYEIDTQEATVAAIVPFLVQLGYPSATAKKVKESVTAVNNLLAKKPVFGMKTRVAMAAAGVALLAAGPIGLAVAAGPGLVGAAAVTSSLAAFGPGGMAGGIAMLTGLGSTGGMITAAAATIRSGSRTAILDPTSLAIKLAVAQSLKNVGEDYDTELWEQLAVAESQTSAELNRLSVFSDEKAPSVQRLESARELVRALQKYMKDNDLIPAAVLPAVSEAPSDAQSGSSWMPQLPWS